MNKLEKMLVPLLMVAVFMKTANALLCYSCDSTINPACHDLKNGEIKPVACTPSKMGENVGGWLKEITKIDYYETTAEIQVPMQCQKIIATNENGVKITFRGCQLNGGKSDMCDVVKKKTEEKTGIKITECISCDTDNCNGSEQHLLNKWSLIVPLSVLLILGKMSLA